MKVAEIWCGILQPFSFCTKLFRCKLLSKDKEGRIRGFDTFGCTRMDENSVRLPEVEKVLHYVEKFHPGVISYSLDYCVNAHYFARRVPMKWQMPGPKSHMQTSLK